MSTRWGTWTVRNAAYNACQTISVSLDDFVLETQDNGSRYAYRMIIAWGGLDVLSQESRRELVVKVDCAEIDACDSEEAIAARFLEKIRDEIDAYRKRLLGG